MIGEIIGLAALIGAASQGGDGQPPSKGEAWLLFLPHLREGLLLPISERFLLRTLAKFESIRVAREGAPDLANGQWMVSMDGSDMRAILYSGPKEMEASEMAQQQKVALQKKLGHRLHQLSQKLKISLALQAWGDQYVVAQKIRFNYLVSRRETVLEVEFSTPNTGRRHTRTIRLFEYQITDLLDMMRAASLHS